MKKQKRKPRGINITVSPKAHRVMSKEVYGSRPKKSFRQIINVLNHLPANE